MQSTPGNGGGVASSMSGGLAFAETKNDTENLLIKNFLKDNQDKTKADYD